MIALLALGAEAFCGLYVAEPGKQIHNQGSSVILAQTGGETTLTLQADFEGDVSDFGMLIPIPEALEEGDVELADPELFGFLDAYTTPRLVQYTCADMNAMAHSQRSCGIGCGKEMALSALDDADSDVEVESRFTVGEYEIVVLRAEEGSDLLSWLDANGFAAPDDPDGIVQSYIDAGTHFLAARVVLDAVPEGQAWLHPLRFSYASRQMHLPIRIGTMSAEGAQDLTIYTLTDADQGQTRITNYPEVTVEDECLWPSTADETLDGFYQRQIDAALAGQAGWWTEYSIDVIGQAACDPCTGPAPLYVDDLRQYGWDGALAGNSGGGTSGGARLTRIHMRYTPEQAVADLDFEKIGPDLPLSQIRYVQYAEGLEAWFPICEVGWIDDPPTCPGQSVSGTAVPIGPAGALVGLVTAIGAAFRRRS